MLVSSTEVIAFELSDGKHLQKDAEQFLIKATASIRKKDHRGETPSIVLDFSFGWALQTSLHYSLYPGTELHRALFWGCKASFLKYKDPRFP